MSGDSWDKMRLAKEEEFFNRQNKDALERLTTRKQEAPRPCPVDGSTMKQLTLMGVNIDQCESCKGVWLDGGELEAILKASNDSGEDKKGWIEGVFRSIMMK